MVKKNNHTQQRIILLHPDSHLLNQFSFKSAKKKIVWNRKYNNPTEIALNEWPSIKWLKIVLIFPFLLFIIATIIPAIFFLVPMHFVNKEKGDYYYDKYFECLGWLAKPHPESYSSQLIRYADSFSQSPKHEDLLRVLFIEKSKADILLKIDKQRIGLFIDEIWLYDDIEEIISRSVFNKYILSESFIAGNTDNNNQCTLDWLNEGNSKIIAERERLKRIQEEIEIQQRPRGPRINLNPNDFLNNDVVFYYESTYNPKVNEYILNNYESINEALNKKSMQLLYIPKLLQATPSENSENFNKYVSYLHPGLFPSEQDILALSKSLFSNIDLSAYYKGIALSLNIPEMQHPVFLHSVEIAKGIKPHRNYTYSYYELKGEDDESLKEAIDYYLTGVSIAKNDAEYRVVAPDFEDPDDVFAHNAQKISSELQNIIDTIKASNNEKIVLASMAHIINSFKDVQPDLCKSINKMLYDTIKNKPTTLSRLFIDAQHRIFLKDYDNTEIDLSPLPKTLYLFMLKNPNGIRLKELSNHKQELIDIYSKVGNRLDMEQIRKSINDLIDPRSNSINEKCSRIKEAFLLKIDDTIAHHYYITGNKSENKKVTLDRSLVIFS